MDKNDITAIFVSPIMLIFQHSSSTCFFLSLCPLIVQLKCQSNPRPNIVSMFSQTGSPICATNGWLSVTAVLLAVRRKAQKRGRGGKKNIIAGCILS